MNFPILMIPHFRYGRETPWAGETLHRQYQKYALGNQIGESYDFSTVPGHESTAPDGTPLSKFLSSPFVIKWVDAKDWLSIHIHPHHDEYLLVVHAAENAKLVSGLRHAPENNPSGLTEDDFEFVSIKAGDMIRIPAGVPHSISGATCYQIQNTGSESMRIYDWNRTNARGQMRPLQIENALPYIKSECAVISSAPVNGQLINANDFTVYELTNCRQYTFPAISPFSVLTCVSPAMIKIENGRTLYLCAGQTLFISGNCTPFTLTGDRFFLTAAHA